MSNFSQAVLDERRNGLCTVYHVWLSSLDMAEAVRPDNYRIAYKASVFDAALCVMHKASLTMQHFVRCAQGVSLLTQHFEVAKLCRHKVERLTHPIMYTCLYSIM
jgi:hypothetical protein